MATRAMSGVVLQIFVVFVCLVVDSSAAKFSANFIFGDSLVEAGNNDYIVSLSKANYPPNGIDFGSPTGRYTNGRTIVDIIGKFSGFLYIYLSIGEFTDADIFGCFFTPGQQVGFSEFAPPYLAPSTRGPVILQGVNYASGGGGILNETGKIFVSFVQIQPFIT